MVFESNNKYKVLGLMSGSSLDGLDLAFCKFENENKRWNFTIVKAETIPYTDDWLLRLKNAHLLSGNKLIQTHIEYGRLLGDYSKNFLLKYNLNPDFIASHGHTVFHQPELGYTFQLGDGQSISSNSDCKVISDFRTKDISIGGQGAPLVPIGDKFLFSNYEYCLNLGGIANISFTENNKRIAFDICPVNQVFNHLSKQLGLSYDDEGKIARSGKLNNDLLTQLNCDPYYHQAPPKSLSNQYVFDHFIELVDGFDDKAENKMRTVSEHVAVQISNSIHNKPIGKILVTGGGAYNSFLIEQLNNSTNHEFIIPGSQIIDYKEALIFAFMGVLRTRGEVNCLSSVTGAKNDCCGGIVFHS